MNATFWATKTVLVTGHTGFKGSWLCLWLLQLGAKVIGYSLPPPTTPNLFTVANISNDMVNIEGDIRDYNQLKSALDECQPDIIFHLAAQPLVRHSYQFPIETYSTNVMGTVHLLEAARTLRKCKAIVNITTDKCYENHEWCWGYRENDSLGGYDPYSNSKACAELVSSAFRHSFYTEAGLCGLATARAGNVIGGGDWAQDRLVPDIIRAVLAKEDVQIRYPHALRPWQHVLEPLSGYLLLAESLYSQPELFAEAWNFGPDNSDVKPVHWLVSQIISLTKASANWQMTDEVGLPHEAGYLKLDSSKAKSRLYWQSQWNLEDALAQTVSWYLAHYNGENMREKTLEQIKQYSLNLQDN